MYQLSELTPEVVEIIRRFPTNPENLLKPNSYFRYVYTKLLTASSFLEIGYRKGLFVEICRHLKILSVHIDITDKNLKARPDAANRCITIDSITYLKDRCDSSFDLIFQDGSKEHGVRNQEYDLIEQKNILRRDGCILVDDLHYKTTLKAFNYAQEKYGYKGETCTVSDKDEYLFGMLIKSAK